MTLTPERQALLNASRFRGQIEYLRHYQRLGRVCLDQRDGLSPNCFGTLVYVLGLSAFLNEWVKGAGKKPFEKGRRRFPKDLESGPGYVDDRIFRRFLLEYFTLCDPEPDCVVTFQNYDFPSYRPYHAGLLLGGENRRMIMFDQLGPGYPFRIANTWRYCCSGNIEYGGFYKPKDPELIRPGKQQKLF